VIARDRRNRARSENLPQKGTKRTKILPILILRVSLCPLWVKSFSMAAIS
jgi:hypothetical protein